MVYDENSKGYYPEDLSPNDAWRMGYNAGWKEHGGLTPAEEAVIRAAVEAVSCRFSGESVAAAVGALDDAVDALLAAQPEWAVKP